MPRRPSYDDVSAACEAAKIELNATSRALTAQINGHVVWHLWRRVKGVSDGTAYRCGMFDAESATGAKVIVGFRCTSTGQRDQYDVLTVEDWRRSLSGVGGMSAETFLLRELCGWAEQQARKELEAMRS
jgi:hypothetical protein